MTVLNRAQLTALVTSSLPDNSSGLITPQIMRTLTQDMVDSYQLLSEGIPGPTGPTGPAGAAGTNGANGVIVSLRYTTLALMNANTTAAANTGAEVYADGANNGVYIANGSGVWTLTGAIPSADLLIPDGNASKAHHIFSTQDGLALGGWENDGLHDFTSGADIILTGSPYELATTSTKPLHAVWDALGRPVSVLDDESRLHLHALGGDVFNKVASNDMALAKVYESFGDTSKSSFLYDKALNSLGRRLRIEGTGCYWNEDSGVSFCREPWSLPLTATTGLTFFSQRNSYYNNGENAQRSAMRTYTIDYTAKTITFSPTVIAYQPPAWTNATPGGWAVNPVAWKKLSAPNAGRIYVLLNTFDSTNYLLTDTTVELYVVQIHSDDNGATWSTPVRVFGKEQVFDALAGGTGGIPGSVPTNTEFGGITGTGNTFVRKAVAPNIGRIVVAVNGLKDRSGIWYVGTMYSDDEGVTWTRGTLQLPVGASTNLYSEVQIAECADGSIYMSIRSEGAVLGRGTGYSTDGGATFGTITFNMSAAFGNSSSSLMCASYSAATGFGKIIQGSTTDVPEQRSKFKFRLSYDNGATFVAQAAPFLDIQGVGYCHLTKNADGNYILTYETFNAGPGSINTQVSIGMLIFNEADLISMAQLS